MEFSLNKSLEILANTPFAAAALLENLSDDWITNNEGGNTWTVKEVVAHLIECEETNWLPRIRIILRNPESIFPAMNMKAHFESAKNNSIQDLLAKFKQLRESGIIELKAFNLQEADFLKTANHPVIGQVNLAELISTWVAHDMTHMAQIARIIAKQNREWVGCFKHYLTGLN